MTVLFLTTVIACKNRTSSSNLLNQQSKNFDLTRFDGFADTEVLAAQDTLLVLSKGSYADLKMHDLQRPFFNGVSTCLTSLSPDFQNKNSKINEVSISPNRQWVAVAHARGLDIFHVYSEADKSCNLKVKGPITFARDSLIKNVYANDSEFVIRTADNSIAYLTIPLSLTDLSFIATMDNLDFEEKWSATTLKFVSTFEKDHSLKYRQPISKYIQKKFLKLEKLESFHGPIFSDWYIYKNTDGSVGYFRKNPEIYDGTSNASSTVWHDQVAKIKIDALYSRMFFQNKAKQAKGSLEFVLVEKLKNQLSNQERSDYFNYYKKQPEDSYHKHDLEIRGSYTVNLTGDRTATSLIHAESFQKDADLFVQYFHTLELGITKQKFVASALSKGPVQKTLYTTTDATAEVNLRNAQTHWLDHDRLVVKEKNGQLYCIDLSERGCGSY